ncbi:glycosyltransferase family 2 protein [Capnocytophaga cynodegmi]|uniref:Putative Beta-(1,4)-galactosyltransferase, Family GT2 n=1 Tax=Capnocytophaga cynodegmi TaxID=28189 RepID=A0A0B7H8L7_9FLAO|nr:glycosyltransferase [Capnocytophaga cynodegmi]CEN33978.1 putative Beta-(1,4)-galactosyltransferase, Family GT2 [Capnocytophaga cynodegmi]
MQLSIIIPVYNTEKYLERCVTSLFDQNLILEEFEVILVNDGSTDSSLLICNQLAKKHQNIKVYNQENQGQSVARNVGLKHAVGKYIYFIDSDDFLDSGYLNDFIHIIEKEKLDFLGFQLYNTSQAYTPSNTTETLEIEVEGSGLHIIGQHNYYNGSCWFIFERTIAKNLFFEEGRLCEDIIFTTLLLLKVKNGRVYRNQIYGYFNNDKSTIKTKDPVRSKKINEDMFYVAQRFSKIIEQTGLKGNRKVFYRLKTRQESYTYFAIVRFLRSKRKYSELEFFLSNLKECKYPAYPITKFKGYNKRDELLIRCFNNKLFLQTFIKFNRLLNIIK